MPDLSMSATGASKASARSRTTSPHSPKAQLANATVQLQAMQFFDDWHARVMKTSLGTEWTRTQAVTTALDLLALNGVNISKEDIEWMANQNEELMIAELCGRLTFEQREGFEGLAHTLQVMLLTTARVRMAVDNGNQEAMAEVMGEDAHGAIADAILKEVVICGSREVGKLYKCQDTWVGSMERKMMRLSHSADAAASAGQMLLKIEAQLEGCEPESKTKLQKALKGFCLSSIESTLAASFSQWAGVMMKNRAERKMREALDMQITEKEIEIMKSKARSIENIKAALGRHALNTADAMLSASFESWKEERGAGLRQKQEDEELNQLNIKLKSFDAERVVAAKKVFERMTAGNDEALLVYFMQGWRQAAHEQKMERELDTEVEQKAVQIAKFLKTQKADARGRLERSLLQSTSSILQMVWEKWVLITEETRGERIATDKLMQSEHKFKSLMSRQKANTCNLSGRMIDQNVSNLVMQCLQSWELEAKVNRVEKYFKAKLDGKRKQLDSVRLLFRSFAEKLEEGLDVVEAGDDSSRINQPMVRKTPKSMSASVSLPDINVKQRR